MVEGAVDGVVVVVDGVEAEVVVFDVLVIVFVVLVIVLVIALFMVGVVLVILMVVPCTVDSLPVLLAAVLTPSMETADYYSTPTICPIDFTDPPLLLQPKDDPPPACLLSTPAPIAFTA